ncbi:MAG: preprotein translocase subunit YajC [Clostridia bacterium]|nr:preprotein translocase subunit YajC [Clostridia bacterium]
MDAYTIFMLVLLVAFAVLLVMSAMRKKKAVAQTQEMRNELKKGDKVMTDSGIVGEIVDSYEEEGYKYFVLKSGRKENVSFFSVHANAIYYVFGKDDMVTSSKTIESKIEDEIKTDKPEIKEEAQTEKKEPAKKSTQTKKKTTKK